MLKALRIDLLQTMNIMDIISLQVQSWWATFGSLRVYRTNISLRYSCRTILHEEDRYPEPHTFNPRRFLGSDGQLDPNVLDPTEAFGFSRRICAGRYFAHDLAWLAIATILTVFKVEKPVDENGMIIEPSGEWTSGLMWFVLEAFHL